jgi:hypothetical protein
MLATRDPREVAALVPMPRLIGALGFEVNERRRRGTGRPATNVPSFGLTCEQLVEHLHARRVGRGWIARCPAHEDRSPSLSIREGEGSRVLLHCFAGCTVESICDALKIKLSDLFSEPGAVQPKPHAVREAEKQIASLRNRLTPRERVLPVTVVYCDPDNLDVGIARALALAVEGELVQAVLADSQ